MTTAMHTANCRLHRTDSILIRTIDRLPALESTLRLGWPEHPDFTHRCFPTVIRIAEKLFDGAAPLLPVVVTAVSPYGRSIGSCALSEIDGSTRRASRIWLKRAQVESGDWPLVLLHEMLHASLSWRGLETGHNERPWCDEITRITAAVGRPILARPIRSRRVDGRVVKWVEPGHLTQRELGRWPHEGSGFTAGMLLDYLNA